MFTLWSPRERGSKKLGWISKSRANWEQNHGDRMKKRAIYPHACFTAVRSQGRRSRQGGWVRRSELGAAASGGQGGRAGLNTLPPQASLGLLSSRTRRSWGAGGPGGRAGAPVFFQPKACWGEVKGASNAFLMDLLALTAVGPEGHPEMALCHRVYFVFMFILRVSGRRGRSRESEAGSALSALTLDPETELEPMNQKIVI